MLNNNIKLNVGITPITDLSNGLTKFSIVEIYSELNLQFSNLDEDCQMKAIN